MAGQSRNRLPKSGTKNNFVNARVNGNRLQRSRPVIRNERNSNPSRKGKNSALSPDCCTNENRRIKKKLRDCSPLPEMNSSKVPRIEMSQGPNAAIILPDRSMEDNDSSSSEQGSETNGTTSMRIKDSLPNEEVPRSTLHTSDPDERMINRELVDGEVDRYLSSAPLSGRRFQRSRAQVQMSTGDNAEGANRDISRTEQIASQRSILTTPETYERLRPAFNELKLLLLVSQRDKRAYAAAVISQKDKIDSLERELQQKSNTIVALEHQSKQNRSRSSRKAKIWSQESLDNAGLAEYQGICLAVGRYATNNVSFLISESFQDPSLDGKRRRDWRSSASPVSLEHAKQAIQYVQLPSGNPAIPKCTMVRALEQTFYSSPFSGPTGFLQDCLKKILESPVAAYMSADEKKTCEARIMSHRPTVQKFRSTISDAVGNRKKVARNTYLRLLGYHNASKCSSNKIPEREQELRKKERDVIFPDV